jgi:pimeloyl-ACP methyl ester carboxylesterase
MMKKTANVHGVNLSYWEQGSGETIVLLHGFCGSKAYWRDVIPPLARHFHVIAPDLRGHGDSDVPAGTYTMERMSDDIAGLLDQLGIGQAALFGHSLGGYVTLAFAEKHADRLTAFALIHSTAFPDDEKGKEARDKAIESIGQNGMEPFIRGLIPKLFAPANLTAMPEAAELAKRIGLATNPQGAINTARGMKERPDRNQLLQRADKPVLLVAGSEDQIIAPEKTFFADGPHINKVLLPQVGHMSLYEAPDKLCEAVAAFMNQTLKS